MSPTRALFPARFVVRGAAGEWRAARGLLVLALVMRRKESKCGSRWLAPVCPFRSETLEDAAGAHRELPHGPDYHLSYLRGEWVYL